MALDMVNAGFAVFPCACGEKRPALPGGFYTATLDPEQVEAWWSVADYNIGLPCGCLAADKDGCVWLDDYVRVAVIDDDSAKHGSVSALQLFEEETGLRLQPTVHFTSGNGGHSYIYMDPDGIFDRPYVNKALNCDIRGTGSYSVVPPSYLSNHEATGDGSYAYVDFNGFATAGEVEAAFLAWYVSKMEHTAKPKTTTSTVAVNEWSDYVWPTSIGCGERNNEMFRVGRSLCGKGFPEEVLQQLFEVCNEALCDEPLDDYELSLLLRSAINYGVGDDKWLSDGVNTLRKFAMWAARKEIWPGLVGEMAFVINDECLGSVLDNEQVIPFLNKYYRSLNLQRCVIDNE